MNGATTIQERLKDLRLNKGLKLEEHIGLIILNFRYFIMSTCVFARFDKLNCYRDNENCIRIISARQATKTEQRIYLDGI